MFHNIFMLLSKPPAGFYHAQSQIIPETQYLTHTCPIQPAGGVTQPHVDPSALICIPDHKPRAGFYRAQS